MCSVLFCHLGFVPSCFLANLISCSFLWRIRGNRCCHALLDTDVISQRAVQRGMMSTALLSNRYGIQHGIIMLYSSRAHLFTCTAAPQMTWAMPYHHAQQHE